MNNGLGAVTVLSTENLRKIRCRGPLDCERMGDNEKWTKTEKSDKKNAKREMKSTRKESTEIGEEGRHSTRETVKIRRRDEKRSEGQRAREPATRSDEESCLAFYPSDV